MNWRHARDLGEMAGLVLLLSLPAWAEDALIHPEHFEYLGAFRMPAGYDYAGNSMTYYPGGDPDGPDDGFPGSIYAVGHAHRLEYAEVAIPAPVISPTRTRDECPVADTLRGFRDINTVFANQSYSSGQRVAAIEYLPAQAAQATGKLYYAYGDSYIPASDQLSYAWCELDLTGTAGPWALAGMNVNCQADYLFEIPQSWAAEHTPGMRLVSGRYRNDSWCGHGPAFFAFGPWLDGNPPPSGAQLTALELLHYTSDSAIADFHVADKWSGGAWLELGDRSAVVLSGRKGLGEQYYGIQCGTKGYQSSDGYAPGLLFFDPAELAQVAAGAMDVWSPQPYEMMSVNNVLFNPNVDSCDMNMVEALCYDRGNNLLYGLEGDGSRTSVHVWKIGEPTTNSLDGARSRNGNSSDGGEPRVNTGARRPALWASPGTPDPAYAVYDLRGRLRAPMIPSRPDSPSAGPSRHAIGIVVVVPR
jgi:hypothetical protein